MLPSPSAIDEKSILVLVFSILSFDLTTQEEATSLRRLSIFRGLGVSRVKGTFNYESNMDVEFSYLNTQVDDLQEKKIESCSSNR